jgi:hypothetical protein
LDAITSAQLELNAPILSRKTKSSFCFALGQLERQNRLSRFTSAIDKKAIKNMVVCFSAQAEGVSMKPEHQQIHVVCLNLCQGYVRREAPIVFQLQLAGETELYKELGIKNLYTYAVEVCGLPEGAAYSFIAVGKMAKLYPCLREAVASRTLTVSKANRIVSILTKENAEELVEFAKNHTAKEIDREVRRRNPKAVVRAKIKPLTGDTDLLQAPIPHTTTENITRAQTLLAQKTSKHQGIPETITLVFEDYVKRQDPLRRAERAQTRKARNFSAQAEKKPTGHRTPLTAAEKHAVDLRDQRRCTHIDQNGKRCGDDRWIDYHHIIPVAQGGSNHPDNLTTLCSFHHDLVHQMAFPIDYGVSWLRSPRREYRAF